MSCIWARINKIRSKVHSRKFDRMHFLYTSGFPFGPQVAELAKERDFTAVQKHAAAEAAAALETRARATAEQHRADIKALQSQISQLKVRSQWLTQ
jgi:hypothetical protein